MRLIPKFEAQVLKHGLRIIAREVALPQHTLTELLGISRPSYYRIWNGRSVSPRIADRTWNHLAALRVSDKVDESLRRKQ
jgi:hypothetical protein